MFYLKESFCTDRFAAQCIKYDLIFLNLYQKIQQQHESILFLRLSVLIHFCSMNGIKIFILLIAIFLANSVFCQYYYNDVVALQQSEKQYMALVSAHIKQVSATSFEASRPVDNFKLQQTISPDGKSITIASSDPATGSLLTMNTYSNGKLVQTRDSSANVLSVTKYSYNANGNISTIVTTSDDAFMNSHSAETHQWIYSNNLPQKMFRIKDKNDTTHVTFTLDAGNVAQETWTRKGKIAETYYYYYNGKNQLTDIVRFNIRVRKMLPDFLYEYDDAGHMVQMLQVPNGSSDYMIWKYAYNSNGLKERELLYNKQQQLVGRVEYKYN